jgi:hypothetical protein
MEVKSRLQIPLTLKSTVDRWHRLLIIANFITVNLRIPETTKKLTVIKTYSLAEVFT